MTDLELSAVKEFRALITETQDHNAKLVEQSRMFMEHQDEVKEILAPLLAQMPDDFDFFTVLMTATTNIRMNHMIIDKLMTAVDSSPNVAQVIDHRLEAIL